MITGSAGSVVMNRVLNKHQNSHVNAQCRVIQCWRLGFQRSVQSLHCRADEPELCNCVAGMFLTILAASHCISPASAVLHAPADAWKLHVPADVSASNTAESNTTGRSWREPRASRVRRFIYFPDGSTITVTVDFVIPLGDSGASLTFSPAITFTPTTIARASYGGHGDGYGDHGGGYGSHEDRYGGHEARSFAADQSRLLDTIRDGFKQWVTQTLTAGSETGNGQVLSSIFSLRKHWSYLWTLRFTGTNL